MVQQFKETGHPIFTATGALSRGMLKQRKGKSTIHFVNTELLSQTIYSVNQVSVYAGVSNWCYKFALKEEESNTFLHPWIIELWLLWKPKVQKNLMMQSEAKFRVLEKKVHMTQLCEKPLFQYLVTAGSRYQVRPDGEDGWWQITSMQRICYCSRVFAQAKYWELFQQAQLSDRLLRFFLWKFLTNMEWKLRFHQNANLETWLTLWYPEKPSALWLKFILTQQKPDPVGNCSIIFKNPKKACFYKQREVTTSPKQTWVAPSTGETRAGFVSLVPNQRVRRSRPLFMLIQDVEVIWQCLFPKLSQPCYVTSIKTNESVVDRDIVKLLNPYCWESLNEMESKISMTKCGYKRSLKAAQRKGLSTVKTTMGFYVIYERFKGHSGGIPIEPEGMGHVKISPNWKKHEPQRTFFELSVHTGKKDWFQEERRNTKPVKQSF